MEGRKRLIKCIRCAVFLLGLFCLITVTSHVVTNKASEKKLRAFFEEEEDFDVLFTGISHLLRGISPMDAWNDYGIVSYNFGEAGNRLPQNYWVLQQALSYTTPKLVVIDVRRMDVEDKSTTNPFVRNWDAFPLSLTKIRGALDLYTEEQGDERLELLFPLLKYHRRWSSLTSEDFKVTDYSLNKGTSFYPLDKLRVAIPTVPEPEGFGEKKEGSAVTQEYLRKMIELCQDRGIEVMLLECPYPATKEERMLANAVQDIADEYGVKYLNCLEEDKMDILNFYTDMADHTSHVNDSGARKITDYVCAFIKDNYDIPDRREDPSYASWHDDYEVYKEYKLSRLRDQETLDTYLMLLADKHLDVELYVRGDSKILKNNRMRRLLKNIARGEEELKLPKKKNEKAYYALIRNEEGTVEDARGKAADEKPFADDSHDITIVVTAPSTGEEIDRAAFDIPRDKKLDSERK